MRGEGFINICQAALHGNTRYVRNVRSRECGRIVHCSGDRLEVELKGRKEVWSCDECEETVPEEIALPT